jgi:hypothetical protein
VPAGHALSFNTRQLNLSSPINGFIGNQLGTLWSGGCFANTPESPNVLPRHLRPEETSFPIEARVRSYLAVNCAYCHRAGGTAAPAAWDGRSELTLTATGLINGTASNDGGLVANKLVVPGDLTHSIALNRMAATHGFTRMPPLGSNELDEAAITLVGDWIRDGLPVRQTYPDWRLARFGSASSPEGEPTVDADRDGQTNRVEFLAGTLPRNGASAFTLQSSMSGSVLTLSLQLPVNRSFQIETSSDLSAWSLWDGPGNQGLPVAGGAVNLTIPLTGARQFFRATLREN